MSYCRFSSDNWKSCLYCYEDCHGGFTTHVAAQKHVGDTPIPEYPEWPEGELTQEWWAEYWRIDKLQRAWLDASRLEPIGLPFDGQTFHDDTEAAMYNRIIELASIGYHVPPYLLSDAKEGVAP